MTGKWSKPGVPHRGWFVIGEEDLGEGNKRTCEMCESATPRYLYTMQHTEYSGVVTVGSVCGESMSTALKGDPERDRGPLQKKSLPSALALQVAKRLGENDLLQALLQQTKLSVSDAIALATRVQSRHRYVVLEPFAGIVCFRGKLPIEQLQQATAEQLLLLVQCGLLTREHAEKVQPFLKAAVARQCIEEELRRWQKQVREICVAVYKRRLADGAPKNRIISLCALVCSAAEKNTFLDQRTVETFASVASLARVDITPVREGLDQLVRASAERRAVLGISTARRW